MTNNKFNPLDPNLKVWIPPTTDHSLSQIWSREEALSKLDECGVIDELLTKFEIESPEYEYIIDMILYNKAQEPHLYKAFFHALSIGDFLSIGREYSQNDIKMCGEIKFYKILIYGIIANLDHPGFGSCFYSMKSLNIYTLQNKGIRRFMFDTDKENMVVIEVIKNNSNIAYKAPYPDISYAEDQKEGTISIPIRYYHPNSDMHVTYTSILYTQCIYVIYCRYNLKYIILYIYIKYIHIYIIIYICNILYIIFYILYYI